MINRQRNGWRAVASGVTVLAIVQIMGILSCSSFTSTPRQGWNRALGPVVPHDKFPAKCSLCHVGANWTTIKKDFAFDHLKEAGVALQGAHAKATCLMCHNDRGPTGAFAAKGCIGCHVDVHATRLGRMCSDCHNEDSWIAKEQIARHNRTRFPLIGAHAATACFACHPGAQLGNYKGADTTCVTCHTTDLKRAKSPAHTAAPFTTDCQKCHIPTGWKPAQFGHTSRFPLVGGHATVACNACHKNGSYTALPTTCVSCHISQYQATTNPNHAAVGFGTNCTTCHTINTWLGATFNHPAAFPLTAAHAGLSCSACHKNGTFGGLTPSCVNCHLDKYQATTNPNHATASFGTNCQTCHTTQTWLGATFNHPAAFPLTQGHAGVSCSACHKNGVYTGLVTTCVSCHLDKYQATKDPNHATSGFGTDCQSCHTTQSWLGATFNHPAAFPLTRGHAGLSCSACHKNGVYTGLATTCVTCHLDKFQATTSPNHATSGFGTNCQDCHTTQTWLGAVFNHPFPLNGPHNVACTQCHPNLSTPASFVCTNCHTAASTNPRHSDVGGYVWDSNACYNCHGNGQVGGNLVHRGKNLKTGSKPRR